MDRKQLQWTIGRLGDYRLPAVAAPGWIGPLVSRRLSPRRPVRTAITSARIETAVSDRSAGADVQAARRGDCGRRLVEAGVAQALAPALLRVAAAERADVAGVRRERRISAGSSNLRRG